MIRSRIGFVFGFVGLEFVWVFYFGLIVGTFIAGCWGEFFRNSRRNEWILGIDSGFRLLVLGRNGYFEFRFFVRGSLAFFGGKFGCILWNIEWVLGRFGSIVWIILGLVIFACLFPSGRSSYCLEFGSFGGLLGFKRLWERPN